MLTYKEKRYALAHIFWRFPSTVGRLCCFRSVAGMNIMEEACGRANCSLHGMKGIRKERRKLMSYIVFENVNPIIKPSH